MGPATAPRGVLAWLRQAAASPEYGVLCHLWLCGVALRSKCDGNDLCTPLDTSTLSAPTRATVHFLQARIRKERLAHWQRLPVSTETTVQGSSWHPHQPHSNTMRNNPEKHIREKTVRPYDS